MNTERNISWWIFVASGAGIDHYIIDGEFSKYQSCIDESGKGFETECDGKW